MGEKQIEFAGSAIRDMEIEGRLTVCNLSIELGAKIGMIAPDEKTFAFLKGRPYAPTGAMWDAALADWRRLPSDPDAVFDAEVRVDVNRIVPQITWGTSPEHVIPVTDRIPDPATAGDPDKQKAMQAALDYMGLKAGTPIQETKIDWVFIGSCTNSRMSDLRDAARRQEGERTQRPRAVHLLGRDVPVVEENGTLRAMDHDKSTRTNQKVQTTIYVDRR